MDAVVVTWRSAQDLPACLGSLPEGVRAIVVDNASDDGSAALAGELGAVVVRNDTNVGFPRAVNQGLALVTAPLTLLLNPDVVLDEGALERCAAVLESDEAIGVVGPNTRQRDGRPEPPAARRDRTAWHVVLESLGVQFLSRRLDGQTIHDRAADRDVDAVNGAVLLIRTDLFRELGGLDESVFMYLEDVDLCRRVRDAGHRVRFVSGAGAVHGAGSSTGRADPEQATRAYLHRIDADLEFLRRYGGRGASAVACLAYAGRALLGLVVSAVRPARRARYRAALPYALRQLGGREPAPPV